MSKNRSDKLLIEDMLESALRISRYTKGMSYDDFLENDMVIDAVIRNFEIIGEASNRFDDEFKLNNPAIEWRRIRGFRNRIVHDYFGIDYQIVWDIIMTYLDTLIGELQLVYKGLSSAD